MSVRFAATIFLLLLTGCGSRPVESKNSTGSAYRTEDPAPLPTPSPSSAPATGRVTLPYMFTRHGVEIRVNSIEFSDNSVLVNLALQETKGQAFDLPVSTLVQTYRSAGNALSYAGYSRAGKKRRERAIPLAAHDQFSITLFYEPTPGGAEAPGNSLELRFPTGKFWISQAAD